MRPAAERESGESRLHAAFPAFLKWGLGVNCDTLNGRNSSWAYIYVYIESVYNRNAVGLCFRNDNVCISFGGSYKGE